MIAPTAPTPTAPIAARALRLRMSRQKACPEQLGLPVAAPISAPMPAPSPRPTRVERARREILMVTMSARWKTRSLPLGAGERVGVDAFEFAAGVALTGLDVDGLADRERLDVLPVRACRRRSRLLRAEERRGNEGQSEKKCSHGGASPGVLSDLDLRCGAGVRWRAREAQHGDPCEGR